MPTLGSSSSDGVGSTLNGFFVELFLGVRPAAFAGVASTFDFLFRGEVRVDSSYTSLANERQFDYLWEEYLWLYLPIFVCFYFDDAFVAWTDTTTLLEDSLRLWRDVLEEEIHELAFLCG